MERRRKVGGKEASKMKEEKGRGKRKKEEALKKRGVRRK